MADKKKSSDAARKTSPKKGSAKKSATNAPKAAAKRTEEPKAAAKRGASAPPPARIAYQPREARAIQRSARQSPYKMRLVIDQIRGQSVNDALALLAFSKKHAAKQIEKVVKSAVANAEQAARAQNATLDVDDLFIKLAIINEGQKLKRWTPAAMGRATPMLKRTSHVEIIVAERQQGR
jgi:large subunit ribosomal protein L22